MKKTVSIIMCMLILLALLSGCGDKDLISDTLSQQQTATTGTGDPSGSALPGNTGSTGATQTPEQTMPPFTPNPSTSPPPTTPPPPSPTNPSPTGTGTPPDPTANVWAGAYLDVVYGLLSYYGEGKIVEVEEYNAPCFTGLSLVRLIDFDGNGTYELYCAYSDINSPFEFKQAIFGFDNGLVVLREESYVSNPATDVSPAVIFLSKAGKVYLVQIYEICYGEYITLEGGKMVVVLEYYDDFWDEDMNSVNGVHVTPEEVKQAIADMEAGGTLERIDLFYSVDNNDLITTQETIDKLIELVDSLS